MPPIFAVLKTRTRKKDKVNIVTLGCSKNIVDSEVLFTQLKGNKVNVEHESTTDDANIIVVNTCGFIDNAKQESIDTILRYADAKTDGEIDKLFVTGCLSQRYKDDLEKEIPQVDAFFGTMELPALLKKFNADYKSELIGERVSTLSNHYAYLKISEGCDRPCSFCAIPLMRGKHVSRPMEEIVKEAENLASQGVKEIMVIAQDSTYYGIDLYGKRRLADLLSEIEKVNGIDWIRLHYAYPSGFPMDVLEVMGKSKKICRYLDIPLQHGADKILKNMRRGITRKKTEELVKTVREKVPGIAIRTTLIAGHPGETEEDFREMLQFVEEMRFERLGVFTYSHEENTHSFTMDDDVSEEVKQARADEIMEVQQEISREFNQKLIGKRLKVLIDRAEGDYFIGRTEFDSPEVDNEVLINKEKSYLRIGDFAEVVITSAEEFDLYGSAE